MPQSNPIFTPQIFDQSDLNAARHIVLTPESGVDTERRWKTETPWLVDLILKHVNVGDLLVDYGCGVGRISTELVNKGFSVIGVDSSSEMLAHTTREIADGKFLAASPKLFDNLMRVVAKADAVLAIWVLQHTYDLDEVISRIYEALKVGGTLIVADMKHRAVPTNRGWINDQKDVKDHLLKKFTLDFQYKYDFLGAPKNLRDNAYIAVFRKV